MDFIDEFIQEYKNNPCLWKADCVHFKNRVKRQEAYQKLIAVASKHGELYNVERTKQKINNLRCAFRHQLKKYIESKNKGDNDEIYCPKRRYFESLMFLKDVEENLEKKSNPSQSAEKRIVKESSSGPSQCLEASVVYINKDFSSDLIEPNTSTSTVPKPNQNTAKICTSTKEINQKTWTNEENLNSVDFSGANSEIEQNTEKESLELDSYDKKPSNHRKRSSSLSSVISNGNGVESAKTVKLDMDFDKLFSLACKSIYSCTDDHFANFGRIITHKLRSMDATQAIYAEKIIADIIFQGQMNLLSASSIPHFLTTDCHSSCGELRSKK